MRLRIILFTISFLTVIALGEFIWWLGGNSFTTRGIARAIWFICEVFFAGATIPLIDIYIDEMERK